MPSLRDPNLTCSPPSAARGTAARAGPVPTSKFHGPEAVDARPGCPEDGTMMDAPHVKRQHVVSRVVLARFAVDKVVEVEDVRKPGRWRPKSPSAVGYVEDYVRHDSAGAEALWQQTETLLSTALDELDGGVPERGSRTEQTVKDCLALHWARSHSFKAAADRAWERVRLSSANDLARRPELLARIFAQRTGRDDPTPQDLADINDDLHEGPEDVVDGRHFSARVRHFYAEAQDKFADRSLEVGRCLPGARDLVISDNPVVTPSRRKPGLNAEQGVALGDARAVGMPLGQRLFVSLADWPDGARIDDAQGALLNDWQASVRRTHLVRRPLGEPR